MFRVVLCCKYERKIVGRIVFINKQVLLRMANGIGRMFAKHTMILSSYLIHHSPNSDKEGKDRGSLGTNMWSMDIGAEVGKFT
jgi:hypothetical protein